MGLVDYVSLYSSLNNRIGYLETMTKISSYYISIMACEGENVFKTSTLGWSGIVPVCKDKFIEVKDIEMSENDVSTYKVTFNATDAETIPNLMKLVDITKNTDSTKKIIEVKNIYDIPFYADVQIGVGSKIYPRDNLLQVKYSSGSAGNFNVSVPDNVRKEYDPTNNNGIYPTQVLYLLKTYFNPATTAGGRKSRRTINRKRRAVRKRRNTKRHSKTYRR
jgi:hypothetical protein